MVSTSFSIYIFTHLPFFQRHFVTHDALWKTPPNVGNSTAVRAKAAVPVCLQTRRKIVATRRRNSEYRGARLCMAAARPMARQSGYSKYGQGIVQRLARNLWFKAVSIVHTLPEVTSPQTVSDARMFPENTKNVLLEHRTLMAR